MRIESVTAHAFGPLAGETLELAPGLTVVAGVNESAKSSWHAALYAALCGRGRGAPTPADRRLVERYEPWDGAPWRLSAVVVLDDGRRLEVCQDLDGGEHGRAVERGEDGTATDVAAEILTEGALDASRLLGLDRAAFAAVALVDQAEHRAVRDAADGLQQYLRRAAEAARGDGAATPALVALDRFLQERMGDRDGPLLLAQERLRVAREARVVARRSHEQYLADLAASGERRAAAGDGSARVRAAEQAVRALEEVADAARAAEQARATAERSRGELTAAATAAEEAARRSSRITTLQRHVPQQNAGLGTATGDPALIGTVTAARTAWDAVPELSSLEGPSATELRAELAALPADGVDPQVRSLADAHRAALAAAERPAPSAAPRPSPRPLPDPDELRRTADALEAPPVSAAGRDVADPELIALRSAVEVARTRQRAATEAAETAEREAAAAAERYEQLRATASAAGKRRGRRSSGRLRALTLTILAVGVGLAALYFGLLAAVVIGALVILPILVSLLAAMIVVVRGMRRGPAKRAGADGPPVVEDLVGAIVAVREKRAVAGRAQVEARAADRHAAECRERHVAALRGERPDPAREHAAAWCARHGLRADPGALRALAARTADEAARREAERSRIAAAVAETGDALRAALRERGILDQGSPIDQFVRYEAQTGIGAGGGRRAELERALAARVAAEESTAQVVAARREAVAGLRTAAGAVGLDVAGDPETLVRALDGWRAAQAAPAAVAVAERPRIEPAGYANGNGAYASGNGAHTNGNGHGANGNGSGHAHSNGNGADANGNGNGHTGEQATELAALLGGGSAADLQRHEDDLRAERDERLTRAWRADLEACEARRRRDDLATAAGIDPVRAGDRAFVTALLDVARSEMSAARATLAEHGATDGPTEAPAVARADEEVDAAEAQLRRMEQLRRTTALARRYLARAQEQTHRDIAPVLAATLRDWLPGVTRGRYVDALVDPETLAVQVYGPSGRWRPADRLSVGTADQVYLLLRVALAQHLATSGETCPLLLDGVTAQADGERTTEILDLLLKLGAERQVVLFTQEDAVLRWAREHLDGDRHRVRELAPLSTR